MMGTKKWSFYLFFLNLSIVFLLSCTPNWFTFNSVQSCKEWLYGSRSDHGTWKGRKQTLPLAQPSYIRDAGTEEGRVTGPPVFRRSVNSIPTKGGRFCPPFTMLPAPPKKASLIRILWSRIGDLCWFWEVSDIVTTGISTFSLKLSLFWCGALV